MQLFKSLCLFISTAVFEQLFPCVVPDWKIVNICFCQSDTVSEIGKAGVGRSIFLSHQWWHCWGLLHNGCGVETGGQAINCSTSLLQAGSLCWLWRLQLCWFHQKQFSPHNVCQAYAETAEWPSVDTTKCLVKVVGQSCGTTISWGYEFKTNGYVGNPVQPSAHQQS